MREVKQEIEGRWFTIIYDDNDNEVGRFATDPWPKILPQTDLTKFAYRSLFTLEERIAIDNYAVNPNLNDEQKAVMRTLQFDFSIAESINLTDAATIQGTQILEYFGLIGPGRAEQILANQPPPTP